MINNNVTLIDIIIDTIKITNICTYNKLKIFIDRRFLRRLKIVFYRRN